MIDFSGKSVAVVGSRNFPDLSMVRKFVIRNLADAKMVVSGGAIGVDKEAVWAANEIRVATTVFLVNEVPPGVSNPEMYRNSQIVDAADVVVAFWYNKSSGTKDVMNKTRLAGKLLITVEFSVRS